MNEQTAKGKVEEIRSAIVSLEKQAGEQYRQVHLRGDKRSLAGAASAYRTVLQLIDERFGPSL